MAITCTHLADAIIRAKKRGVSVRIVVDSTMVETKGSQTPRLHQYNILTCSMSCPGGLMHNKFAVIDAFESNSVSYIKSAKSSRGTAMSGSFNWTWTGVLYNEENVYISSDADFVKGASALSIGGMQFLIEVIKYKKRSFGDFEIST